ncbi:MAG: hypothetical protein A3E01_06930 [Gammaproteobacteria bacterium RIFCSPHIGHO2_12_FULL_63_22]|nr:MAG: hypothetical protein A3E01_06930 [Gammaproteobacteria bacterium RIFCSPHIGHO2_12_FULL_63_22]
MQNKVFRFGPVAVANAVGNLLNPPTATGGTNAGSSSQYIILRHIRIVNKTAGAVTFSGYIGATGASAAGTEFLGTGLSVAANSYVDWYGSVRLDAADFFTGVASATTSLVIQGEGEIGVAG